MPTEPLRALDKCEDSTAVQSNNDDQQVFCTSPLSKVDEDRQMVSGGILLRSGSFEATGQRATHEDATCVRDNLEDVRLPGLRAFYAVYDGHGGRSAADFAADSVLGHVLQDSNFPENVREALVRGTDGGVDIGDWSPAALRERPVNGFHETDVAFRKAHHDDHSGTTAIAALLLGTRLYVANAGDCRAVLGRRGKGIQLSTDHKPLHEEEKRRIEAASGHVSDDGYLNSLIAVSRAIGDWHLEVKHPAEGMTEAPLICTPEVREVELGDDDEFMILACDGLWDVFSTDNAVQFARQRLMDHNDPQQCAKDLVEEALRRHTTDNVTAIVVCLREGPPPQLRSVQSERNLNGLGLQGPRRISLSSEALDKLASHGVGASATPRAGSGTGPAGLLATNDSFSSLASNASSG